MEQVTRKACLFKKSYARNEVASVQCWIVAMEQENGQHKYWFKASNIIKFLGNQSINAEWKITLHDIVTRYSITNIPTDWSQETVFVSELGLYHLGLLSKKTHAAAFTTWICNELLPSLRARQHTAMKCEIDLLNKQLESLRIEGANARMRLVDVSQDVVATPQSKKLLHIMFLHEIEPKSDGIKCSIMFTRCQRRSQSRALASLKKNHPKARELYHKDYVPNGIHVLNCVKEKLNEIKSKFVARNNIIDLIDCADSKKIVEMVRQIVNVKF